MFVWWNLPTKKKCVRTVVNAKQGGVLLMDNLLMMKLAHLSKVYAQAIMCHLVVMARSIKVNLVGFCVWINKIQPS